MPQGVVGIIRQSGQIKASPNTCQPLNRPGYLISFCRPLHKQANLQDSCRNYIRVWSRLPGGRLLICGTNAFKPMCRLVEGAGGGPNGTTGRVLSEFSGVGISPYDPRHNATFYTDAGSGNSSSSLLFAATGG